MRVAEIQIADNFEQALPLLRANWEETGFDAPFDPSKEQYVAMQECGALFAIGAFDGDQIIGYSTAIIVPYAHSQHYRYCATDALFVTPAYRHATIGARLIAETERIAQARGARFIAWHTRAGTGFAEVLGKRGYEPADVVMVRKFNLES